MAAGSCHPRAFLSCQYASVSMWCQSQSEEVVVGITALIRQYLGRTFRYFKLYTQAAHNNMEVKLQ